MHAVQPPGGQAVRHGPRREPERDEMREAHDAVLIGGELGHRPIDLLRTHRVRQGTIAPVRPPEQECGAAR